MTDLHEIVAELRRLSEAAPLPLHQQESHLAGKDITLKRSHRLLGSASTMQGLGLIFGDDDGLARLIVLAINALPRLLDEVERAAKMEAALRGISAFKYRGRETVSEENAWPAFQKANAQACEIFDIADRALGGTDGTT